MKPCAYLTAPEELEVVGLQPRQQPTEPPPSLRLCTWADESPAGVAALTGAPRWLQRNALGGHLWRPGDCDGCPGYREAGL